MILRAGWVSEVRATGTVHTAKEGWGEDSKQLKNWNFGSSIISLTPSPPSPAAGFALQGRGIFGVTIQICVDNRDFEQVLRQDVPQKILAIHRKPHTVLPRAIQPRTVFSGAPCLKLSVDGYRQPWMAIDNPRRSAIHGRRQKYQPENVADAKIPRVCRLRCHISYEAIAVSPKKETASCEAVLSAGADVLCCD